MIQNNFLQEIILYICQEIMNLDLLKSHRIVNPNNQKILPIFILVSSFKIKKDLDNHLDHYKEY
jgi:hypothetical protein